MGDLIQHGMAKDRIDELANGKEDDIANARFIGEQLNVFYEFKTDGLWQDTPEDQAEMAKWNANGYKFTPGNVKPVDQNGDYKMDADHDRVIIGNKRPTFTAGWTNTSITRVLNSASSFTADSTIGYMLLNISSASETLVKQRLTIGLRRILAHVTTSRI